MSRMRTAAENFRGRFAFRGTARRRAEFIARMDDAEFQARIQAFAGAADWAGLARLYHERAVECRRLGLPEQADEYERHAIDCATTANHKHLLSLARIG